MCSSARAAAERWWSILYSGPGHAVFALSVLCAGEPQTLLIVQYVSGMIMRVADTAATCNHLYAAAIMVEVQRAC